LINWKQFVDDKMDGKCFFYKDVWISVTFYFTTRSTIEGAEVVIAMNHMSTSRTLQFINREEWYEYFDGLFEKLIIDFKGRFFDIQPYVSA